jgi:hypothetical protein
MKQLKVIPLLFYAASLVGMHARNMVTQDPAKSKTVRCVADSAHYEAIVGKKPEVDNGETPLFDSSKYSGIPFLACRLKLLEPLHTPKKDITWVNE